MNLKSFLCAQIFIFLSLSTSVYALPLKNENSSSQTKALSDPIQEAQNIGNKVLKTGQNAATSVQSGLGRTRGLRGERKNNLMLSYAGVDTWIPSKIGFSYIYSPTPVGSWEFSYMRGSISIPFFIDDLGQISDTKIALLYRSYSQRNSFSFLYGLNYYNFSANLGNDYLSSISGNSAQFELLRVESLGLTLGLGNRWQLNSGLSFGVDWFTVNIPIRVFNTDADYLSSDADQADKNDVENVFNVLKRVPTFSFLKFQVGYHF